MTLYQVLSLSKERLKNYGDYDFFTNIQVLTPTKKGKLGTKELNKSLQEHLNPKTEEIEDNNEKYDGMGYVVAENIRDVNPEKIAQDGIKEALSRIGGRSIPSGKYKIIINNEAMVSLLGTFDSIFEDTALTYENAHIIV